MVKRGAAVCLAIFLASAMETVWAQGWSPDRQVAEWFIAPVDSSLYVPDTFRISPDRKRTAYIAQIGDQQFVIVDGIEGKPYESVMKGSLIFSSDSKRFAYVAKGGDKQMVVVDGAEEKEYDRIKMNPLFSPDCRKVVYLAQAGDKVCVVVDGIEGKLYDDILNSGMGMILFTSSDQIQYFARKGNTVVLVEEKIE